MNVRTEQGFTLIEVMVTVVIIAILGAVAIPAYSDYIRRGSRAEAKAAIMEDALLMEQKFTVNNAYNVPATAPLGFLAQSPKTGTAKYTIKIGDGLTAATYTLEAKPVGTDKCGTFIIDNTGLRSLTGNTATVDECWGAS